MAAMDTNERLRLMNELKESIIKYLEGQKTINLNAYKAYEDGPIQDSDPTIKRMRERERIKIMDRIMELDKHIAVIKLMVPSASPVTAQKQAKKKSVRNKED